MANKVDIANEKKRTPTEVLTVEVMKMSDEFTKMSNRFDEIEGKMDNLTAAVSSLVDELRKNATGNINNGETREETLKRIESSLKELLRGQSNVTEQLSLEFKDVKNNIVKHGDTVAVRNGYPPNDSYANGIRLENMGDNTTEYNKMLIEFIRKNSASAMGSTGSNPRPEVPERWCDLPRYYFYLLPKYRLIQFFHDRYCKGFVRICTWCVATVCIVLICLVLHDNATLRMENEKNELIRSYIRKKSEFLDGFITHVDGLYADKKAHQLEIDTLRIYVSE